MTRDEAWKRCRTEADADNLGRFFALIDASEPGTGPEVDRLFDWLVTAGVFPKPEHPGRVPWHLLDAVGEDRRQRNPLEGRKFDGEKLPWNLLPWEAVEQVVEVLRFGARKYAPENWRHVENARERYFAATQRHLVAWWRGERADPETGLPHLAHAACCVLFLLAFEVAKPESDIRSS